MELLSPQLRAELEESLSQTIHAFFEARLKPRADAPGTVATRTRVTDRQLQLGTAGLFLEDARCDFDLQADEFNAILGAVQRMMGLTEDKAVAVIRSAEEEVRQSKIRVHGADRRELHFRLELRRVGAGGTGEPGV